MLLLLFAPSAFYIFRKEATQKGLASLSGGLDYYVFHESAKRDVVVGKDGWLFYSGQQDNDEDPLGDYTGTDLFTPEELAQIADNLTHARDVMEARGGTFLFVISPSKARIYPEHLPERFGAMAEETRMDQLERYLGENTDLHILVTTTKLKDEKAAAPERRLFLKYDTHESYAGAYASADAILAELGLEALPPVDGTEWHKNEKPHGDLANILGLLDVLDDDMNCWSEGYHRHFIELSANEDESEMRAVNVNADGDPRKLMMISDSFGGMMFPYLADSFNESYLVYPYLYSPDMLDREDPDILVYEVTERFLRVPLTFSLE